MPRTRRRPRAQRFSPMKRASCWCGKTPHWGGGSRGAQAGVDEAPGDEGTTVSPVDGYPAVRVQEQGPETFAAKVVTIPAGSAQLLLPQDKNRARATVVVVTAASTAILSPQQGNAAAG